MEILDLNLLNFRNFTSRKFVFDKSLTVIIGANGSGKSNILEAVSLVCGQRPVHIESDLDLVRFGKSEAKISSRVEVFGSEVFDREAQVFDSEVTQTRGTESAQARRGSGFSKELIINFQVIDERVIRKSYLIDGFKKRFANFLEIISIIVFHPEDLDLVAGTPSLRRHHLDSLLSASDRDYWRNISSYGKVVTRRNRILNRIAEGKSKPLELNFWDGRLLEHGKYVSKKREEFINFLNLMESVSFTSEVKNSHTSEVFFGGLRFELMQSLLSEEKLFKNRERDIAAGVTLSGPHRDDFRFIFKGRDLAYFGSRGEQRMAVLALKLSELEYLKVQRGARPILALDDIFSELDWEHRETVLSVIGNQQTIITAAEKDSVPKKLLKKAKIIEL